MTKCPYCGGRMRGVAALPFIPPRQRRIYDAVIAAGIDGVASHDLLKIMYGDKKPPRGGAVVMRVNIHELNKVLVRINQRIKGRQGYRLTKIK